MKKTIFLLPCFIFLSLSSIGYSHGAFAFGALDGSFGKNTHGLVRLYGGLGYTFNDLDVQSGNKFHYKFGSQLMYLTGTTMFHAGVGVDLGYSRLYKVKSSSTTISSRYVNTLLVGELTVFVVSLQVGLGPYFGLGDDKGTRFGLLLSAGLEIPVDKFISIPVMIRSEYIFADNFSVPLTFYTGLTFYLP